LIKGEKKKSSYCNGTLGNHEARKKNWAAKNKIPHFASPPVTNRHFTKKSDKKGKKKEGTVTRKKWEVGKGPQRN